jgi:3-dehydroquinate synthase
MVGAFWQPRAVAIDVNALTTLPEREYLSGLAETVKYGVILDEPFFSELESSIEAIGRRDEIALTRIVARCCQLKADVVRQDEREETGLRAVLNYGHTFAHGLEAATDYGVLLHGEAVAIGMACAARLAVRLGLFNRADAARQQALLDALGLSTEVPSVPLDRVLAAMRRDKKSQQGRMHFVLPRSIGHVETVEVADEQTIRAALMG